MFLFLLSFFFCRYYAVLLRRNYVTPTSYLELIKTFKSLLGKKRFQILTLKTRYLKGLEKLDFASSQVSMAILILTLNLTWTFRRLCLIEVSRQHCHVFVFKCVGRSKGKTSKREIRKVSPFKYRSCCERCLIDNVYLPARRCFPMFCILIISASGVLRVLLDTQIVAAVIFLASGYASRAVIFFSNIHLIAIKLS